jgi:hypothetical protein
LQLWRRTERRCLQEDYTFASAITIAGHAVHTPNGLRIINSLFPKLVVISLSSSLPTCTNSLSARSTPISSHVSLRAVYSALSSAGSCLPPGKAICDDQRCCEEDEEEDEDDDEVPCERLMNNSSGVDVGWFTQAIKPSAGKQPLMRRLLTKSEEVLDTVPQSKVGFGDDWPGPALRHMSLECQVRGRSYADDESDGGSSWLSRW